MKPLVERYLGSLPSLKRKESWMDIVAATVKDAAKQYLNTQSFIKVTLFHEKKSSAN